MATISIVAHPPVNFTRADLDAAVSAALSKVTDPCWTRAIHRAAGQFVYDGHQVILRSRRAPSSTTLTPRTDEVLLPGPRQELICWLRQISV